MPDRFNNSWGFWYGLVLQFIEKNGPTTVPVGFVTKDGFKLGQWAGVQRSQYRQGILSKERQRLLEKISGWAWDVQEQSWQNGFVLLKDYIKKNGPTTVPIDFVTEDGFKLGQWTGIQRSQYRQGILSKERQKLLEKISGWVWDVQEQSWQNGFALLKDYIQNNSFTDIRQFYRTKDGFKLGTWFGKQHTSYGLGRLSKERQELLESLPGWKWRTTTISRKTAKRKQNVQMSWERKFQYLKKYRKQNGHVCISKKIVLKNGFKLGAWVTTQKYLYRKDFLSKDRQHVLEKIPEWTWKDNRYGAEDGTKEWFKSLDRLKKHIEREGNADLLTKYVTEDGYHLGLWVCKQRNIYKRGMLSKKKQELLEKLPEWSWGGIERTRQYWLERLNSLIEYAKENGTKNISHNYITNDRFQLWRWVSRQRQAYKRGKLSEEQKKLLEQSPGWTWNAKKKRQSKSTAAVL